MPIEVPPLDISYRPVLRLGVLQRSSRLLEADPPHGRGIGWGTLGDDCCDFQVGIFIRLAVPSPRVHALLRFARQGYPTCTTAR